MDTPCSVSADERRYQNQLAESEKKFDRLCEVAQSLMLNGYAPLTYDHIGEAYAETGGLLAAQIEAAAKAEDEPELGRLILLASRIYWEREAMREAERQIGDSVANAVDPDAAHDRMSQRIIGF